MIITNDFIFHFESEDVQFLFEETLGENWKTKVIGKQRIGFKDDSFALVYLKGHKPKEIVDVFKSLMLGFVFLNGVNPNRNSLLTTSSTPVSLITQACLALSEYTKMPLPVFFDEDADIEGDTLIEDFPDEDTDGEKIIPLIIKECWCNIGLDTINFFIQNGWIYAVDFDPTELGAPVEEGQNDSLFIPTGIFLAHFEDFEIEIF